MSGVCYPDSLIGSIPNIYYYAANNPSEATIAKRRSYANTISYLTPPAENAGLYKGLKELKELISSYQGMRESGRAEQVGSGVGVHRKNDVLNAIMAARLYISFLSHLDDDFLNSPLMLPL